VTSATAALTIRAAAPADAEEIAAIYDGGEPFLVAETAGIGRRLLEALVTTAEAAGYWKLQGRLFATNAASAALARRCGFREVGVYERHGRLGGEWKDLLIVERLLGEAADGR
jgi:RimJ/RimL family protein N-acetyltransferase